MQATTETLTGVAGHPTTTLEQVHVALACYYDREQEIDADIEEGKRYVEELKGTLNDSGSHTLLNLSASNSCCTTY